MRCVQVSILGSGNGMRRLRDLTDLQIGAAVAIAFVCFPFSTYWVFDGFFDKCYLDDGCGWIDPFVLPIIFASGGIVSALCGILAVKIFDWARSRKVE